MMSDIYYFAYGSNMSSARLNARVPSAKSLGVFHIPGFHLDFSMHGFDDSAKCNANKCNANNSHINSNNTEHKIYGIIFTMAEHERVHLDHAEQLGEGYELIETIAYDDHGNIQECFLYTALRKHEHLKPYCWYKNHVITGAKEAQLPSHIIEHIESFETMRDPDEQRHQEQMAIHSNR